MIWEINENEWCMNVWWMMRWNNNDTNVLGRIRHIMYKQNIQIHSTQTLHLTYKDDYKYVYDKNNKGD